MSTTKAHYLVLTFPAWGHCRPETVFSLRLIQLHPHLSITLLISEWYRDLATAEIAQAHLTPEEASRLRVVFHPLGRLPPCDPNGGKGDSENFRIFADWVVDYAAKSIEQTVNGDAIYAKEEDGLIPIPPTVFLGDAIALWRIQPRLEAIFNQAGLKPPVLARLNPLSEAYIAAYSAADGSPLPTVLEAYQQARTAGSTDDEAFQKTFVASEDKYIEVLGLSPMSVIQSHMTSLTSFAKQFNTVEALSITFWPSYESIHGVPMKHQTKFKGVRAGPQLFDGNPTVTNGTSSAASDPTLAFMDTALARHGPRSVIYVCFGTLFWPPTEAQTALFLDALEESGLSVVLVKGHKASSKIAGNIQTWYQKMGSRAHVTDWVPQLRVLQHEAINVFVSHGGSGSTMEAMITGVPMVLLPGAWDQPFIASELCKAGIALDIAQFGHGHNIGKKTARGVLVTGREKDMKAELREIFGNLSSDKFDKLRQTAREIQQRVLRDLESGESFQMMQKLGHLADQAS
ncbi:hypothetical protein BD324DRAFT_651501 [Kockovaella imperatae]|uniref:Uncharacterized protein n=1 Tax=Kockovaella imperatae TaxID=4999 RepID=A0A1Y1UDY5_9TREE|nr:hypothetical protein BD324DRAFT_651501 [Kockovaella imperatae]ORX36260.1 hypothetical protein BD324DRAFT_651501 [Kockovaella imperatae]